MKRLLFVAALLFASLPVWAEGGKGIRFSRGEMILFALLAMGALALAVLAISGVVYVFLQVGAGKRRFLPIYLVSYIAAFAGVLLFATGEDPNLIGLVLAPVLGAVAGYFIASKKTV